MKRVYLTCLFLYFNCSIFGQSTLSLIDSLLESLELETDHVEQVDLLNDIAFAYYRNSVDRQLEFARKAYKQAEELGYIKGQTVALKNIGIGQRISGAPLDSILYYYRQGLDLAIKHDFDLLQLSFYNNIGRAHERFGQYHQALDYLLKSLEIDKQHKEVSWTRATILGNIGALYYNLKDYEKALNYLEESFQIGIAVNREDVNRMHVDDLALTRYRLGQSEQAETIIQNSIEALIEAKGYESLYQSTLALIDIKLGEGKIAESKSIAFEMLQELEQNDMVIYRCRLYNRLADIELAQSNGKGAISYASEYLDCTETKMSNILRSDALHQLYLAYVRSNY